jgi:hypothetical protein
MRMLLATILTAAAVAAPTTEPATNVTNTGATLNGTVDGPATVWFEYRATAAPPGDVLVTDRQTVSAAGEVSASVSRLTPETEYAYRIVTLTDEGGEVTFTTAANPLPPTISNQQARDVKPESATATASVNANGSSTDYFVEWGTTTRYGRRTSSATAGSGSTPTTVKAGLDDLRPFTLYHWRTVATNAAGITRGRDRTFRTGRLPSSVTIGLSRRTVPWGGDTRVGGRASGIGIGGMTIALEQQRFPLDQTFTQLDTARTGSDGGYLFTVPELFGTTRYRVVTQTHVPVTSPVVTARSAVKVGIRVRHRTRTRASVEGMAQPGVHGTASLQRYRPGRGWRQVKFKTVAPADELRTPYRFSVKRPRKRAPAYRLRVILAPVRGAHVRGKSRTVVVRPRPR